MGVTPLGPFSLERTLRPVELVRDRLRRAAAALELAKIPYAVIGGDQNVREWHYVATITALDNFGFMTRDEFDNVTHQPESVAS